MDKKCEAKAVEARIKLRHNLHFLKERDPGALISNDGSMRILLPRHNDEGDDEIRAVFVESDEDSDVSDSDSASDSN